MGQFFARHLAQQFAAAGFDALGTEHNRNTVTQMWGGCATDLAQRDGGGHDKNAIGSAERLGSGVGTTGGLRAVVRVERHPTGDDPECQRDEGNRGAKRRELLSCSGYVTGKIPLRELGSGLVLSDSSSITKVLMTPSLGSIQ